MSRLEVFEKLQEIFMDLLDDEEFQLSEDISMDTLKDWDSLMHISLISAVEDEFDIKFSMKEVVNMENVGEMADIIVRELKG